MQEHTPVMMTEVLYFLNARSGKRYIDATLGSGGHTEAILKSGGEVLGIDQDPNALEIAKRRLKACPGVFKQVLGNFSKIAEIARRYDWQPVSGILFDLGFASFQVEDPKFGLSFLKDGLLDMRMNPTLGVTAADLVNSLPEKELANLFFEIGQEKFSRQIAKEIVARRRTAPFQKTKELSTLIAKVYETKGVRRKLLHPATKVFMSLRIAVNSEFENLREGLAGAMDILGRHGRLVVISFHSGEDRIVKDFFNRQEKEGKLAILTKKPVVPAELEIRENPRARSAKLRAAEKI